MQRLGDNYRGNLGEASAPALHPQHEEILSPPIGAAYQNGGSRWVETADSQQQGPTNRRPYGKKDDVVGQQHHNTTCRWVARGRICYSFETGDFRCKFNHNPVGKSNNNNRGGRNIISKPKKFRYGKNCRWRLCNFLHDDGKDNNIPEECPKGNNYP